MELLDIKHFLCAKHLITTLEDIMGQYNRNRTESGIQECSFLVVISFFIHVSQGRFCELHFTVNVFQREKTKAMVQTFRECHVPTTPLLLTTLRPLHQFS